jgi:hypothetical protein
VSQTLDTLGTLTSLVHVWVPAVSAAIIALTALAGVWITVFELRGKLKAQADEARSRAIEADVRLADVLAQLVPIADGRILSQPNATVGTATQIAAITQMGELAREHVELRRAVVGSLSHLRASFENSEHSEAPALVAVISQVLQTIAAAAS